MSRDQVFVLAVLTTLAGSPGLRASEVHLSDGTGVPVKLLGLISSETSKPGDGLALEVARDVVVDGTVAIKRGTPVSGTVIDAAPGRLGALRRRAARLVISVDRTSAVGGQPVRLRSVERQQGEHRIVVRRATRSHLLLWAAEGATFDAFVDGEHHLAVPPATVPVERLHPDVLTNEDVVKLLAAGMSDDVVVAKIQSSRTDFRLGTDDLIQLKNAGVPERVLIAMMEAARGVIRVPARPGSPRTP